MGGGLLTAVERRDGEFVKVLKRGDEHRSVERLRDKTKGVAILEKDNLVQRGREEGGQPEARLRLRDLQDLSQVRPPSWSLVVAIMEKEGSLGQRHEPGTTLA